MKLNAYEIGLRVYNIRTGLSKKQTEISEATGISQSKYSRFECGYDIPLTDAIKICDYLGISISYLIGDDDPLLTEQELYELERYKNYLISQRIK